MDKKMRDMKITEIIDLTASDAPAPGGGSIAALVAALGSALGQMVLALSYGKKSFESLDQSIQERLRQEDAELTKLRERLVELIDLDVEAFSSYMAAFRLPKASEEEKAARREAIDGAALFAMQVPLETAERCLNVLNCLPIIAEYGNQNAVTDAGVASLLATAACEAALLNVRINLPSIKDEMIRSKAEKRMLKLLEESQALNQKIMKVVYEKLDS